MERLRNSPAFGLPRKEKFQSSSQYNIIQAMKIKVKLDNRWARLKRPYPYEKLIQEWSYFVPGFQYMKARYPGWDGRKKFLKFDKVPAGLFRAT